MSNWLSDDEMKQVTGAEVEEFASPVPTRVVSNGEYNPIPQTDKQKQVQARIAELGEEYGKKNGMDRRQFLKTSSGMAAAFIAMNEVFGGGIFNVNKAEASDLGASKERRDSLKGQLIFDNQTHFNRDDLKHKDPIDVGWYAAKHWNPGMLDEMGIIHERFQFENYLKEMYLDSDTSVALLSTVPFDDRPWLITNEQAAKSRALVNGISGSRRMLCHAAFTPGVDGWEEKVDEAIELKPDSWKGYTIGDPMNPQKPRRPWRLDEEELVYPFYEKIQKAGINTVCIHKGLIPADYEKSCPGSWPFATVQDLGKAAKDWPGINFVIYHSAMRPFIENPEAEAAGFEETGYLEWASDLAAIPEKYGVNNVYAELGTTFANCCVTQPRLSAGLLGTLIKHMGVERVLWGTDSTWYGSPQWQIEAFRRLEIPEDMQKKFGFAPMGGANSAVKNQIFWDNGAELYGLNRSEAEVALSSDVISEIRGEYLAGEPRRTNLTYGYVHRDEDIKA